MSRLPIDKLIISGEQRVEIPLNNNHSVITTGELTVMIKFKLNKLNNDVTESERHYVNFCGKTKYEVGADDNGKEYYFRYYNLDSVERSQRMSFYHFNNEAGLGAGAQVQEPVAVGEWVTLVGRVNMADNRISISKNGVLIDTNTLSSYNIVPELTPAPFTFGRIKSSIANNITVDMTFNKAIIWNRELADDEVLNIESGIIPQNGLVDSFLGDKRFAIRDFKKCGQFVINGEVNCGHGDSLNITDQITFLSWIKLTKEGHGSDQKFFFKDGQYKIYVKDSDSGLTCSLYGLNDTYLSGSGRKLKIGKWYFLAVTYDGSNLKSYINGKLDLVDDSSGNIATNTNDLKLGEDLHGLQDESYILNRALTQVELENIYYDNKFPADIASITKLHIDFDDNVEDQSGNGNDGTPTNMDYSEDVTLKPRTEATNRITAGVRETV